MTRLTARSMPSGDWVLLLIMEDLHNKTHHGTP